VLEGSGSISFEESVLEFAKGDCIFIPKRSAKMHLNGQASIMTVRM